MTRWPRAAAPAWPVHVAVLAVSIMACTAYALAGPHLRPVIFALVTLVPVATFAGALGSGHLTDRRPWQLATAGLVVLSISMAGLWPAWVSGHHLGRAEGRAADFVIAGAHLIFLAGTAGALRKHGRNDLAGILDAALFGVSVAGPIWAWLISPRLTAAATPLGSMLALADVAVLVAVLGCIARIGHRVTRARGPITYLLLTTVCTLGGHITAVLTATSGGYLWTSVLLMLAFLTIGAAAIHPAAPLVTNPDRPGRAPTRRPPLLWMGAALCANPLIAAIQAVRGDASASILLPVGTMLAVPLVLLRLQQMSILRNRAERTLAHHANHDDLTGLFNRRHAVAEIDRALADLDRGELDEVTVLLLDLDGFKPVNDRFGHQAGDAVLRTVANRLSSLAEDGDLVGRIGGDEFLVVRRGRGPGDLAERLADLMARPVDIGAAGGCDGMPSGGGMPSNEADGRGGASCGAAGVCVGVSSGAATARRGDGIDRDTLIGRADAAMYAEKTVHRVLADSRDPVRLS